DLLVEQVHHQHRVDHAAVDTGEGDGAAAAHDLDSGVQRVQPVDAPLGEQRFGEGVRQPIGPDLGELSEVRAVRLHPDGVDDGVRAATPGAGADGVDELVGLTQVEGRDAVPACHGEPFGYQVGADDLGGAAVEGDL